MRESRGRRSFRLAALAVAIAIVFTGLIYLLSDRPSEGPFDQQVPAKASYTSHGTIFINGDAQFNNTLYPGNGVVSGNGTASNPYVIAGWDINASADMGITIWDTSVHFIIRDCYIHDGWADWSGYEGIRLIRCANATVTNNIVEGNSVGISHDYSSNCVISDNVFDYNEHLGIYVYGPSSGNTISNNTCRFNNHYGISVQGSSGNILKDNNFSGNHDLGVYLILGSNGNTLLNNTCADNNWYGIVVQESPGNTLIGNTCSGNYFGVYISQSSNYNNISWNKILANSGRGIHIQDGAHNRIWCNTFVDNCVGESQAYDGGTDNWWNTSGTPHGYGNYWSDWTGPDVDADGIVDVPYDIAGAAGADDYYPLTETPTIPIPEFSGTLMPMGALVTVLTVITLLRHRKKEPQGREERGLPCSPQPSLIDD